MNGSRVISPLTRRDRVLSFLLLLVCPFATFRMGSLSSWYPRTLATTILLSLQIRPSPPHKRSVSAKWKDCACLCSYDGCFPSEKAALEAGVDGLAVDSAVEVSSGYTKTYVSVSVLAFEDWVYFAYCGACASELSDCDVWCADRAESCNVFGKDSRSTYFLYGTENSKSSMGEWYMEASVVTSCCSYLSLWNSKNTIADSWLSCL